MMNYATTIFLTVGGWVIALLFILEWILPGYVLPYFPLPLIAIGYYLLLLTTTTIPSRSPLLTAVLIVTMVSWIFLRLWEFGLSGKMAIMAVLFVLLFMVRYAYEKHTTLS